MDIDWFPLWLSLRVAVISTAIALTGGLWLAWILANRQFRGKELLDAAVTLPLVLPPTVLGYYLLVVLGRASPIGRSLRMAVRRAAGFFLAGGGGGGAVPFDAAAGEIGARGVRERRPVL